MTKTLTFTYYHDRSHGFGFLEDLVSDDDLSVSITPDHWSEDGRLIYKITTVSPVLR